MSNSITTSISNGISCSLVHKLPLLVSFWHYLLLLLLEQLTTLQLANLTPFPSPPPTPRGRHRQHVLHR
jgi:hypothetical protein